MSDQLAALLPPHVRGTLALLRCPTIYRAALRVPNKFWSLSVEVISDEFTPSRVSIDLREAFWRIVSRAAVSERGVQFTDIVAEARCSYPHAYALLTSRPYFLVWLFLPGIELQRSVHDLVPKIVNDMRALLELPDCDINGKVLVKNVETKLRVWEFLDRARK